MSEVSFVTCGFLRPSKSDRRHCGVRKLGGPELFLCTVTESVGVICPLVSHIVTLIGTGEMLRYFVTGLENSLCPVKS